MIQSIIICHFFKWNLLLFVHDLYIDISVVIINSSGNTGRNVQGSCTLKELKLQMPGAVPGRGWIKIFLLILQRNNDQNTAEILEIYVLIRKEQNVTRTYTSARNTNARNINVRTLYFILACSNS